MNYIIKQIRVTIDAEDTVEKVEQMKIAIDNRCKNFKEDKYSMLNSLLNREKKSIVIDHLVIKDEQGMDRKVLDEKLIKQKVKENFEQITNYDAPNRVDLEQDWNDYYNPRSDIDSNIYQDLLAPISIEEWMTTCSELNKNKAPGITEISYDIIKKSGADMNNIIRELINEIFKQQILPNGWLKAQIFPIPKPVNWGGNINKTRPITLLECPRKIMFKILNNRLANILVQNNYILGNNNFAALPGRSTIEPIHTINCILEDARENKKELWMLFQDMSKAYDRVNRKFLYKALRRICLPTEFISLLKNSLEGRTNHVITAVGNTDEYIMENGIDQGEVISPLLWVIYYNPLFERINYHQENAYKMEFKFQWQQHNHLLEEYLSSIAYMDDTTFLAPSKQAMKKTLEIADNFNLMTGIIVNPEKSELIVINSDEDDKSINYGHNTYNIKCKDEKEPVRYLGVWLSGQKNDKFITNQCKEEIINTTNRLRRKKITSQQVIYVFNAVIIPRIEYRTNLTILNEKTCVKLQVPIRKLLRHKSNLVNTLPNTILWNKEIYGLLDIFNRCIENQTSNLIANINDTGKLGNLMEIRIAQLQIKEWLPHNPLTNWPYFDPMPFKYSITAQILSIINNWEINIKWNKPDLITFKGNTPLSYIIEYNKYRIYKDKLRDKKLMFLDQITEESFLLQWDQLSIKNDFNRQGKIPKWWRIIENKLISSTSRFINDSRYLNLKENLYKSSFERLLMYTKIDKRKNNWIITKRNHTDLNKNVVIGLLVNKFWDPYNDTIKLIHYRFQSRTDTNLTIFKCSRTKCDIGVQDNAGNCILSCDRYNSLKINCLINKISEDRYILKQAYFSLFYELSQLTKQITEMEFTDILISERENRKIILLWLFKTNNQIIEDLLNIYDKLRSTNELIWEGYTDGSLNQFQDSNQIDMGLGWIIVNNNNQVAEFCASSYEWPSSTRMELMAVTSLISTLPPNSTINIFTDSSNIIERYNSFNKHSSFRRSKKIINYNIWEILFWIKKEFSLNIKFTKVKAHSGHTLNDKADLLAKLGTSKLPLRINDVLINQKANLAWMEYTIDIGPRKFMKEVENLEKKLKFDNLNRIQELGDVDKQITLEFIDYKEEKQDLGFFSLKDDNIKSFRIKKLFNELPVMENLKKRKPTVYKPNTKCPRCHNKEETISHLWECSKANNDIVILSIKARKRLFKLITQSKQFKDIDMLFNELFPFFKTEQQLKRHTKQNSDYYRQFDNKKFKQDYTYIWNSIDSFDNILHGGFLVG